MTFADFLTWAQGPGINAAVGALLSFVGEYVPQYTTLPAKTKRLVFGASCLAVPVLGAVLGCAMGYQPWNFDETFWPALYQGALVAFGVGTLAHARKLPNFRNVEDQHMAPGRSRGQAPPHG